MSNKKNLKGIEYKNETGTRIEESEGRLGIIGKVAKYAMAPGIYATKKALGAVEAISETVSTDKSGTTNFFKS